MGSDPADLALLLDVLSAHRVKRYECNAEGALVIELHPPEPEPPKPFNPVAKADQGKITQPTATPYHTLFGGDVPNFRAPSPTSEAAKG